MTLHCTGKATQQLPEDNTPFYIKDAYGVRVVELDASGSFTFDWPAIATLARSPLATPTDGTDLEVAICVALLAARVDVAGGPLETLRAVLAPVVPKSAKGAVKGS
jgi:hypothetical protein